MKCFKKIDLNTEQKIKCKPDCGTKLTLCSNNFARCANRDTCAIGKGEIVRLQSLLLLFTVGLLYRQTSSNKTVCFPHLTLRIEKD